MLKSFDFFRKIQTDQQYTSTTGGAFTISALIIGSILIIMSFQDYYHESYNTFLAVKNDEATYFPLRIDMTLNKMPCQAIQISFHDELEYIQQGLEQKLQMFQVMKDAKQIGYKRGTDIAKQKADFQIAVNEERMCRITGILNLPKTPGTLSVKNSANHIVPEFKGKMKTRMSYIIKTMQFGLGDNKFEFPISHMSPTIQKYVTELQDNHTSKQYVLDHSGDTQRKSYYNHVKIIPITIQHSKENIETGDKYRYSLRSAIGPAESQTLQIKFLTQIQPIHIVYRKEDASIYDLIVRILAIVGGSVATIGIINSISHALFGIK